MARSTGSGARRRFVTWLVRGALVAFPAACDPAAATPPAEAAQASVPAEPSAGSPRGGVAADGSDPAPPPEAGPGEGEAGPGEGDDGDERATPPAAAEAGGCPEASAEHLGILVSPSRPGAGQPMRIVAASLADERMLALRLEDAAGAPISAELVHRAGVPAMTIARLVAPDAGTKVRVIVGRDGEGLGCRSVRIARPVERRAVASALDDGVWPVGRSWSAAEEALFSGWVRELFHAPRGEELAWSALHEVTGDAERNLLHDHFGWGEDSEPMKGGVFLRPDCADTPYFLRAYYAWKRRLPYGFRRCSRGGRGRAPVCGEVRGVVGPPDIDPAARLPGELALVQRFFKRTLAWGVHTGNGRTAFGDDETDFYPVALTRRSLRPGVIYADPYGHIFVVSEWMAPEGEQPGVLYAIDGQPDGSITRKRFWEGNFLWNPDPALGGSGFKGTRPHRITGVGAARGLTTATDAELAALDGYRDVGLDQAKLDAPAFYDHMDGLITPGIRDPIRAQHEAIQALYESALVRVTSVDNGEANHAEGGREIEMPSGFEIFETTGSWENFSTPARDLRLLIAIDVATGFEAKVARNPAAWGVEASGGLAAVDRALATERERLLAAPELSFEYTRSDGSPWRLTLSDLVARAAAFETAYNPNDCPEHRWGAPEGSDERSPCRRRAPAEQQRKMAAYRPWFRDRRRPPRGDPGPTVE